MTYHKFFLVSTLGLAYLVGCAARHTELTSQIQRPLQSQARLGDVAIVSVVMADKDRPSHSKWAAEARKSLQQELQKNPAVHAVVESVELPPLYGDERSGADTRVLMQRAREHLRGKQVDTVCLVQLKDLKGELTLGLAIPPKNLVSVHGQCDYQLQLIDLHTGQELFCSTGTCSERTDSPTWVAMPSAAHLSEKVAQELSTPAPAASPAFVAERPNPAVPGSAARGN